MSNATHSGSTMKKIKNACLLVALFLGSTTFASEADLAIPDLHGATFNIWGASISSWNFLFYGAIVIAGTLGFSLFLFHQVKRLPAHESMEKVASIIYATCRTYLIQQGKFLLMLFALVATVLCIYFLGLVGQTLGVVIQVLLFSIVGMAGSYIVAWYGIRMNTYANARTAFASLKEYPLDVVNIPLKAGMSVGLFLISLELVLMVVILLFVPRDIVGICFLGFAIGESLGASALRIAGGIFTKIADIGSDLMKVVFKVKEDDPRNPGVIADCTGDNAGDSVGPTADGFETYGVTGVALIAFITLAVSDTGVQAKLIVWIFSMRFLMDFLSGCSFFVNQGISKKLYKKKKDFDFETPLMRLIVIAAVLCISASFFMSYLLLGNMPDASHWWKLAIIISCGTLAATLIPEFTKFFTSSKSKHVKEVVTASREGGPSLNILSGIVAGYFGAFWTGLLIAGLMAAAFFTAQHGLTTILGPYATIFAFGLVAFGFLCMGPVTIAVDSYGPVTDNAQSVFELSQIEKIPNISESIEKQYGFKPDFEKGKYYLEANDSAGNTFKATAKPVLIGTAVVGATTMIFSIILLLEKVGLLKLSLTDAPVLLGLICGGAVIFWFSGASTQAVTTGAYRAVAFIKRTFDINKKEASIEDSKAVVKICTLYAQKGMWNIFIALISLTLAFAFLNPNFFVAYLVSIAVFGLFQAIYMANAGGSWDNAKKIVEVELKEKHTPLHEAAVVGDTVGDPFKDTSSVSLNPIIKFSTLFGLLATEICIHMKANPFKDYSMYIAIPFLILGLVFVWRSFYCMRIPDIEECRPCQRAAE
ncbi:MAG: putative K(+)-stimulated pyrophosphate-energized sodium pump [Lentisphaerae bacterium ADurb.Bin242]|nr:MAG: putative K(+)-stimulated pyrophosphate-energized sodium pump [Lentisphaerae bacterium ADurb.Bin242]